MVGLPFRDVVCPLVDSLTTSVRTEPASTPLRQLRLEEGVALRALTLVPIRNSLIRNSSLYVFRAGALTPVCNLKRACLCRTGSFRFKGSQPSPANTTSNVATREAAALLDGATSLHPAQSNLGV